MKIRHVFLMVMSLIVVLLSTACSSSSGPRLGGSDGETTTIAGRILNSHQNPVPHAEIEIYISENAHKQALADKTSIANASALRMSRMASNFTTRANEAGEFALANIPSGEYTLRAHYGDGQQFLKSRLSTAESRDGMITLDVVLTPAGSASGKVTYLSDPVKNAVVYLEGTKYVAITDEDGEYSFENVAVSIDGYTVKVLEMPIKKNTLLYVEDEPHIEITKGGNTNIGDIKLYEKPIEYYNYSIKGEVTGAIDDLDQRLVVAINLNNSEDADVYYGFIEEGTYFIPVFKTGNYMVSVTKEEDEVFSPEVVTVTVDINNDFDNPAICDAVMKLETGFRVAGTFKKASGEGIADKIFKFVDGNNEYHVLTNGAGNFTINLPEGDYDLLSSDLDIEVAGNESNKITVKTNLSSLELIGKEQTQNVKASIYDEDNNGLEVLVKFVKSDEPEKKYFIPTLSGLIYYELPRGTYNYSIYEPYGYRLADNSEVGILGGVGTVDLTESDQELGSLLAHVIATENTLEDTYLHGFEVIGNNYYVIHSNNGADVYVDKYINNEKNRKSRVTLYEKFNQVSTAVYNNSLYVLVKDSNNYAIVHWYDEDLNLMKSIDTEGIGNVENASLFVMDTNLYLIDIKLSQLHVDWHKLNMITQSFTSEPEFSSKVFETIKPCFNGQYLYYPSFEVNSEYKIVIEINALDFYMPTSQSKKIAEIVWRDSSTPSPTIYLTLQNNTELNVLLFDEQNEYYSVNIPFNEENQEIDSWDEGGVTDLSTIGLQVIQNLKPTQAKLVMVN